MFPALSYDTDFAVASLLFSAAASGAPGFSVSPEDQELLGQCIGEMGKLLALTAHREVFSSQSPSVQDTPHAGPSDPLLSLQAPLHPAPYHTYSFAPLPPHLYTPYAPPFPYPSQGHPLPSTSAPTSQPTSYMAFPPPITTPAAVPRLSTKVLGKRKAASQPDAAKSPAAKKHRGMQPRSQKIMPCLWDGCGDVICSGDFVAHMKAKHFPGELSANADKRTFTCLWVEDSKQCPGPQKRETNGVVKPEGIHGRTALNKHLRDVHFGGIDLACPICHVEMRGDSLRRHAATHKK